MKYDDASWHYGGSFPSDLPNEAGGTHIGMFVAWCLLNGLAGEIHTDELPEMLEKLRNREVTPGAWFLGACDEKFTDEDLSEEGNAFAKSYFDFDAGRYIGDYERVVGGGPAFTLPCSRHVADVRDAFSSYSEPLSRLEA